MMAGCGVMVVGVLVLPLLGIKLGGAGSILLALACPLSMVFMMGFMGKGHDHSGAGSGREDDQSASCHGETAPRALPASSEKE